MSPVLRRARHLRPLAALALAGALGAACTAAPSSEGSSSTTTSSSTTSTTTTTTTTLPNAVGVNGSAPSGPAGFLGPISRIPVVALAPGLAAPPQGSLSPIGAATLPRLAFRSIGSGPSIVVLVGEHATLSSLDPAFLNDLVGSYQVTELDLPGVGYSDEVAGASLDRDADLVAGLIVELNLTDPVVVGWGLGASVALTVAERHRNLINGLVALDPIGATRPTAAIAATLASPTATPEQLASCYFPATAARARAAYLADLAETVPDEIVAPAIRAEAALVAEVEAHPPSASALAVLDVPTLVVGAADDEVAPMDNATALAAAIPNAHLDVLNNAGYGGIFAQATTLVADLHAFTGSLPTPTALTTTTTTTTTTSTTTTTLPAAR